MALVTPCSLCDVEHVRRFRTPAAARQVCFASRLLVSCLTPVRSVEDPDVPNQAPSPVAKASLSRLACAQPLM